MLICNRIGNLKWLSALETDYLSEFTSARVNNFTSSDGHVTGFTKSAGKGSGNVAFVSFHEAGHMVRLLPRRYVGKLTFEQVPHDQPVASLDMFSRWLKNEPLAHGK
jgi:cathepsin A (carboxypeptidase C)